MDLIVASKRPELERLCARHHVRRLELFGSAATGRFDARRSDLDFLVEFLPLPSGGSHRAYFGLLHDLQDLFQRPVDLVMVTAIRNRYFLESVNESRTPLYAA